MEQSTKYATAFLGLAIAILIFVISFRKVAPSVGVNPAIHDAALGQNAVGVSAKAGTPEGGPAFMGYNWGPPLFMQAMMPAASAMPQADDNTAACGACG